jgi:FtsP/CotA-like multicopper oxidase with cupredoxin domain
MKPLSSALRGLLTGVWLIMLATAGPALAKIDGIPGASSTGTNGETIKTFNLVTKDANIVTNDGNTIYAWGYADATTGTMQYPGPVLIVNQGDTVRVNLSNTLPVPVSIVFPGQQGVIATGGTAGLLTNEVAPSSGAATGPVTYSFIATQPGTYLYHSGTQMSLQKEMGLVGGMVVRPTGFNAASPGTRKAYGQTGTQFDREFLILLTDMDSTIHDAVYAQVRSQRLAGHSLPYDMSAIDTSNFYATLWFINGRNSPDTLVESGVWWLPNQPYSAAPIMHPGEKMLVREINAGRDLHPFHHHGAHMTPIARDGRVIESAPGVGPDLSSPDFTIRSIPGQTMDLTFEWTGKNIGWDIYGTDNGHTCNEDPVTHHDPVTHEWCPDHGKPFPVVLPNQQDVQFGEYYGGSPYLGTFGSLPQGHPGLNENGGYFHIWHSHSEKEITTNNIFPGGMKTFLIIEAPNVPIVE